MKIGAIARLVVEGEVVEISQGEHGIAYTLRMPNFRTSIVANPVKVEEVERENVSR